MVVIVCKQSDSVQWLVETTCAESNDALIRRMVRIHNLRIKIEQLSGAVGELAKFGPSKPSGEEGIDEITDRQREAEGGVVPPRGDNYQADPSGKRTGQAPSAQIRTVLEKVCADAVQSISKDQVARKVALSTELLQEKVDTIRGAVTIAYPMGLPPYDPVRCMLESEVVDGYGGNTALDPETATLWWAGKEFHRDQKVGDRVGRNEKTKIVGKLQKPGGGAPQREQAVSEAERKAMMAHYFKKQEEMKKIAENDDDDYANSAWANPKNLKASLQGTGAIRWR